METIYHPSAERGHFNFGWLDSHHSFSFGNWHDREKVHFGALRVLNDDVVKGGQGFDNYPHENMEIISIPLKGALTHKDSTGTEGIVYTGDVQIMSAGSGISHSEYNASHYDNANFLQIWIFPKQPGIRPRHDQRSFHADDRRDKWQIVVSPLAEDHALWINQEARLALIRLSAGKSITYKPAFPGNGIYLFILEGTIATAGRTLEKRDGIGIAGVEQASLTAATEAEVLAIEVPMFA
ncbi:MAG TPA: pirin family protein [Puia sp.]|nr:pirin family protein [Puia sp.]